MILTAHFSTIPLAEWPREGIYRRLGFRRSSTQISTAQREEMDRYLQDAFDLIRLQGAVRRMPLRIEAPDRVLLSEEHVMTSRNLAEFLAGCGEAVLLGATAGSGIMEAMADDMVEDRVTRAVVLDAAASETVDAALDWLMAYLNQMLRREGKTLKNTRYSAGYGDLPVENQRTVYRLLDMGRLGVSITESCILIPEKSVTALTGIIGAA
jgi:hypothetical protein